MLQPELTIERWISNTLSLVAVLVISFLTHINRDHNQFIPLLYQLDLCDDNICPMTELDCCDQSTDDLSKVKCACDCDQLVHFLMFE